MGLKLSELNLFKNKKGSIISDYFRLLMDVGQYTAKNMVQVALYEDHLELSVPIDGVQPITLNYSQILEVEYKTHTTSTTVEKSRLGRTIDGALWFGKQGAMLGMMTDPGVKEKTKLHYLFIVRYRASEGGVRELAFEDTRRQKGSRLAKKLKELCGLPRVITQL